MKHAVRPTFDTPTGQPSRLRRRVVGGLLGILTLASFAQAAAIGNAQLARGEYLARLGDCVACHTAAQGKPLAGGRELTTPFGTLYSTNITPDRQTGIGGYSFE